MHSGHIKPDPLDDFPLVPLVPLDDKLVTVYSSVAGVVGSDLANNVRVLELLGDPVTCRSKARATASAGEPMRTP